MVFIDVKTIAGKRVLVNVDKIEGILQDPVVHQLILLTDHNKYVIEGSLEELLEKINQS